jgi:putative endonuclease
MMTNRSGTLYVGVTNDLERRVIQHKAGKGSRFARRYAMTHLLYFEESSSPSDAIQREKEIKGWLRKKKIALVRELNPRWRDLAATWGTDPLDSSLRSE